MIGGPLTFSFFSYICHDYIDRQIGSFATDAIRPYVTGDHPMLFARDLVHSCTALFVLLLVSLMHTFFLSKVLQHQAQQMA